MEKKNYIVAIDLGSSNVVVAVAERDAEGRPAVRSIVSKPSQGVKAGMITNIEQVSNSIKAAVEAVGEELGIRITEAYTGISGDFVRCARHTDHVFTSDPQNGVNRTDVEALFDRMRNVQAPDDETIMERIPQNYLVDENQEVADPVGSFGKRLASTFNFILCAKTPIERLNLALRRLGIRSLGMYANALVTGAAVLSADEKEEGAAVVNIGGGVTDVAVYYRNVPRYIATIPMGAGAINNDIRTLGILVLGVIAFCLGTAGGVLLAKVMNFFSKGDNKINPLIGSAGVSAVPMAARVSQTEGQKADPSNFLLMHAMGPNVAGVVGSAVAAGILLSFLG